MGTPNVLGDHLCLHLRSVLRKLPPGGNWEPFLVLAPISVSIDGGVIQCGVDHAVVRERVCTRRSWNCTLALLSGEPAGAHTRLVIVASASVLAIAPAKIRTRLADNTAESMFALALPSDTLAAVQARHDFTSIKFAAGSVESFWAVTITIAATAAVEACNVSARVFRAAFELMSFRANKTAVQSLRTSAVYARDVRTAAGPGASLEGPCALCHDAKAIPFFTLLGAIFAHYTAVAVAASRAVGHHLPADGSGALVTGALLAGGAPDY